jgi:glucose-6-phosphate isomerase
MTADPAAARSTLRDALRAHQRRLRRVPIQELFAADADRARTLSLAPDGMLIDFSKQRIVDETLELLVGLAQACELPRRIDELFSGAIVNPTENRPALHTALRADASRPLLIGGRDVAAGIRDELDRMFRLADQLRAAGRFTGVVNIGIGGSDLGPRLAVDALHRAAPDQPQFHFIANIDDRELFPLLERLDAARTLFVVASKSFTTQETLANARSALGWLRGRGVADPLRHFVVATANPRAAAEFGVAADQTLTFGDWIGGRYSVWSSAAFVLALAVGERAFREFLAGARRMDEHFRGVPLRANAPVLLGMLDVWYANFWNAETLAILPYDRRLRLLPAYLGQLVMESNGKRVDRDGRLLRGATAPIVWGGEGTPAQHAFFQLLHQGTHLVPAEFLAAARPGHDAEHHRQLLANCFAQSRALMLGRRNRRAPHRNFPGDRPSTTILFDDLTPATLGALLALYEHRTFVQSVIWGNNPFDQWGVELGKDMAREIVAAGNAIPDNTDSSTRQLLEYCRKSAG